MPLTLSGTTGEIFPSWTTAGRPSTPTAGQTGYNSTLNTLERYNGTTWGPIVTTADTATVSQTMLASGTAGNGPAFSAYASAGTSVSNATRTKILFQTEDWDTANCYSSSTFTPNVAGYYLIAGGVYFGTTSGQCLFEVYKNGVLWRRLNNMYPTGGSAYGSTFVYCNGTTDYIELYAYQSSGSSSNTQTGQDVTYFSGSLVRSA